MADLPSSYFSTNYLARVSQEERDIFERLDTQVEREYFHVREDQVRREQRTGELKLREHATTQLWAEEDEERERILREEGEQRVKVFLTEQRQREKVFDDEERRNEKKFEKGMVKYKIIFEKGGVGDWVEEEQDCNDAYVKRFEQRMREFQDDMTRRDRDSRKEEFKRRRDVEKEETKRRLLREQSLCSIVALWRNEDFNRAMSRLEQSVISPDRFLFLRLDRVHKRRHDVSHIRDITLLEGERVKVTSSRFDDSEMSLTDFLLTPGLSSEESKWYYKNLRTTDVGKKFAHAYAMKGEPISPARKEILIPVMSCVCEL